MARFTVRLYSDFGMFPQDQTRILFEANSLEEIKDYIKEYFKYEDYFNAVYLIDNKLNKSGYVVRDLTIGLGESLEHFCEEPESVPVNAAMNKLVLIYSNDHRAWWRPNYCGYTNDIAEAGIFDYEDAIKHCPGMSYDKDNEDYFIDVTQEMIISEMEDVEYEIAKLQEKLRNLKTTLKIVNSNKENLNNEAI